MSDHKSVGDNYPHLHPKHDHHPYDFKTFYEYEIWQSRRSLFVAVVCQLILAGLVLLGVILFMTSPSHATEIDLSIIATIESSNNPRAVGKAGDTGLHQCTPIVVREWNNFHPKDAYTIKDLFDPTVSTKIANWFYNVRIPSMIKHYGKPDTIENRIIAYNAGISYVKSGKPIPTITKNYIRKYLKLSGGA